MPHGWGGRGKLEFPRVRIPTVPLPGMVILDQQTIQLRAKAMPESVKERRERLLDDADAVLRKGLLELEKKYPQLAKAEHGDWVKHPRQPGRL